MELLVVDIETTGFNANTDAIVEIGIVLVNTETKKTCLVFDKVIKDKKFNQLYHTNSWIFKNTTLTVNDVINANSLESYFDEIQSLFDKYKMTAYNKSFDLRFLRAAGFKMNDVECLMKAAKRYSNYIVNGRVKTPSVEEIYNQFFVKGDDQYIEKHRAGSDAIDESNILLHMVNLKDEHPKNSEKIILTETKIKEVALIDIDSVLGFGKHKGRVLSDVIKSDKKYVTWCMENITTFKLTLRAKKLLKR
jgi:DNA polymerase III epsilon subunit-like protein